MERAQTTLRHVVGARLVQSLVTEREVIAFEIAEIVGDVAEKWGVSIEGILIKVNFSHANYLSNKHFCLLGHCVFR